MERYGLKMGEFGSYHRQQPYGLSLVEALVLCEAGHEWS
jgi:hypothetical protein